MNVTPVPVTTKDTDSPAHDGATESTPIHLFQRALALYIGWSLLAWLSHVAGATSITPRAATIILPGIIATNVLFFILARSSAAHRPSPDTITLAQCVVGIAWVMLLSLMSTGTGELLIGIYASIILFAMLRVSYNTLNQLIIFVVISYSVVNLGKMISTTPPSWTSENLARILIFAGIMLCLSGAGRHIYRQHRRLKTKFAELQAKFRRDHATGQANSVNRRYILDLLAREKGRADRSNVAFCICIFNADYIVSSSVRPVEMKKMQAFRNVEANIRAELREMDSLNSTGFHDCFGAYSDKEFIAILPQTNLTGAQRSAERVLAANAEQRDTAGDRVTLYGGIAQYRRGETISSLLMRAENALDRARKSGADSVCSNEAADRQPEKLQADIIRLETTRR